MGDPHDDKTDGVFASLERLALDLRWSWNHATDELWRRLEPELWASTRNPWIVLQTVSRERFAQLLAEPAFSRRVDELLSAAGQAREAPAWFQHAHGPAALERVAYFSMEFMLSEALPIYAGGLGNVAGDQLKAASDLGVPVVGVGLLYQQGYFRQVIDADGAQQALFPYNDPGQLPVRPLRAPDGQWLRLRLAFPGGAFWLRTWQVQVGRLQLYLLDSNDPANYPTHRAITSELYGGGPELRLQQELALGIGGWRLLERLGQAPEVCHLNEGHAAFAILERARSLMRRGGLAFDAALTVTRVGNLFTTHTAVPAGFDRFDPHLIEQYLGGYAREELQVPLERLLALGRADARDASEPFNMAYLAVHGSGAVNGVSRLHGEVSRRIFLPLFPRRPPDEVPVGSVTNGVHAPSWDSPQADELWTRACGKGRWLEELESMPGACAMTSDAAIWEFRNAVRASLVEYVRERLRWQLSASGAGAEAIKSCAQLLNPHVLTLGFARRFATYKRPNLLLYDRERLVRLLNDPQRPVQLILAGKAHPADVAGQALVRDWVQFVRQPDVRPHAVFLSDYDMLLTERLVGGVDLWINTPRRPWEACGTSGMKVLVNGGLNLSELDGWWAEAYRPEFGWALGDGNEHDDDPSWDATEASRLYDLLEHEVIPEFYARDVNGIPKTWVSRVRASMAQLTPRFSANRSVREYVNTYYLPAASAFRQRSGDGARRGVEIAEQLQRLERDWGSLRFGRVDVETRAGAHHFAVEVDYGALDPALLRIELYAEARGGQPLVRQPMVPQAAPATAAPAAAAATAAIAAPATHALYTASVPASRPASDFVARIVPAGEFAVPLEAAQILWQR
ncbi:MAG TPA: alpha-glucan family phosphorylase [Steroidobacteraceae bacterium]|nr:alpha-glucan family phosphorylase [Steroidobacteraceae bacterium]